MKNFILSIQHLLAMFGATVLVPILTGFDPSVAIFLCRSWNFNFPPLYKR